MKKPNLEAVRAEPIDYKVKFKTMEMHVHDMLVTARSKKEALRLALEHHAWGAQELYGVVEPCHSCQYECGFVEGGAIELEKYYSLDAVTKRRDDTDELDEIIKINNEIADIPVDMTFTYEQIQD